MLALAKILSMCICGIALTALLIAMRQQQRAVLEWLVPLAITHIFALSYYLYSLGFRYLHLRASFTSTMIAYGIGVVGAVVSLYATWRIFKFVTHLPVKGALTQEEGVWPPPPTQTR